ncbi:hypothetical protein L6R52_07445 [Myxococcota bacterium]|nr:hypothetical protein [Myxococcota bacterium]
MVLGRSLAPRWALSLGLTAALAACSSGTQVDASVVVDPDGGVEPADALFMRLGGEAGIEAIVNGFVARVSTDPKINGYFLNSTLDGTRLTRCLVKQLVALSGGPATYPRRGEGPDADGCRNMQDAHRGLGISTTDFTDLASHLVVELSTRGASQADVERITRALTPLAEDIVESPLGTETIYHRAGRKPGLEVIIADFVRRVDADPKINGYFRNSTVDGSRLSTCLVRQLCALGGGPCRYGEEVGAELFGGVPCRSMFASHDGLGISTADFTDLATHLVAALQAAGMAKTDVEAVVRVVTPLSSEIVADATDDATIYQRIGRKPAVERVVRELVRRVSADPKINGYFLNDGLDGERLVTCLVRQVCQATGGPCRYGQEKGPELFDATPCKSMLASHQGLGISTQDFNDLAAALVASFTASSAISLRDLDTVVAVLAPLAADIVEDPNGDRTIYQRMGRKPGVVALIDDFVARVVGDPSLVGFFAASDAGRLGTCLVRQVCDVAGGPCVYGAEVGPELIGNVKCRDMASSHRGLTNPAGGAGAPITRADFDALVGHLVDAMIATGTVLPADRAAIGDALAPLCPDIVAGGTGC